MTSSTVTDVSTLLMIDSASARDRDDAFSVTPLPDGRGWAIEVHIAGVADVVGLGSVADEQAFLRAETRYLPNRTIPMLGETAEQAATLTADSRRTSLRSPAPSPPTGGWSMSPSAAGRFRRVGVWRLITPRCPAS